MRTTENRPVEVFRCDGCHEESKHSAECAVCKKEYCPADGYKRHFSYSIELYRYADGRKLISHVCTGCNATHPNLSIQQLFDAMLSGRPVLLAAA